MYTEQEGAAEGSAPPAEAPGHAGRGLDPLLVILQLTDSAFPSGFYTLSHSLEGFAQAKAVDPDSLPALLEDLLRHGVGPTDATALALAHRAAAAGNRADVIDVDEHLYATKLSREMRLASTRTGRQLLDLAQEIFDRPQIADYHRAVTAREAIGTQAVVTGVVYAATGVAVRAAVAADLFAYCVSFAGAALRLRLTDHRSTQALLRHVAPVIEETTEQALRRDRADLGASVFACDVMSGRHERAEARLFAS
ncbi:urease accessory protein UreF [Embleya sp. NPDC059259]|uniref:urease accessory protein UreF n=1 Tax=unclassified Embleya TaxID=2699296 RepID=UPI0036876227